MTGAQCMPLPDGRTHMQHGPIDLIITIDGPEAARRHALVRAWARFRGVLDELVKELPALRSPHRDRWAALKGPIARRMARAVDVSDGFITPMAAVAGAVADDILCTLILHGDLSRVIVNNGGDIAFDLARGTSCAIGIVANPLTGEVAGSLHIDSRQDSRGAATSGWRGRSFSLGIADAVTVVAKDAALADAAATMIANAVDLPRSTKIVRKSACEVRSDSDLGDILVTCDVAPLTSAEIEQALRSGVRLARAYAERNIIHAAALCLDGEVRFVERPQQPYFGPTMELGNVAV